MSILIKMEKRTLIKAIFSGPFREAHDNEHHHGMRVGHSHDHSYDNTGDLEALMK